jgi:hypothetical protein
VWSSRAGSGEPRLEHAALPAFAFTIGLSAFLVFAVQPMFTKMVIPKLGGTPAVWSVAMVFFQATLFGGYVYARVLTTRLSLRTAVLLHITLTVGVAMACLPIAFDPTWGRPPNEGQALWLIMVFGFSIGLPFFAVSANAPLLQAWYATTGQPDAHDPYFLYRASNIGSFLALLSYPFVVEPYLALSVQSGLWSFGCLLLAVGLVACGRIAQSSKATLDEVRGSQANIVPAGPSDRIAWMILGFVPSALLIAVTSHISTDVAAVPLLWIVPLALFLLSFVVAFGAQSQRLLPKFLAAQPLLAGLIALAFTVPGHWSLLVHLAFFFVSATICHARLYALRPDVQHLSSFYCFLAFGGCLGGVFASLVAPAIFNSVIEYPMLVVAALACRPNVLGSLRSRSLSRVGWAAIASILVLICLALAGLINKLPAGGVLAIVGVLAACIAISREAPAQLVVVAALVGTALFNSARRVAKPRLLCVSYRHVDANMVHSTAPTRIGEGRVYLAPS